ncbi:MAG TPA: SDR family NAD(P)-dependent oxidoreductase [Candidatus Baltobacteraceae bacterium]|nr:SDR family NAD(P)-dependent oxidoreductase [Candidatus Baltobacteraceae bacterium]
MEFAGQTAIVTGSARGFGRAIARRLAKGGARVTVADVNLAGVEETATLIRQDGAVATAMQVDVTSAASVQTVVDRTLAASGNRIDILVNNAGIQILEPIEDTTEEHWDKVIAVNLKGHFLTCRSVIPIMRKQGRGHIVNIASVGARNGGTFAGVHYIASKGGVIALTKKLGKELGQYGIVVNGVNPGPSLTDMMADWPRSIVDGVIKNTPLGRMAEPEDIADAVAFLASDAARFITGETIEVNGGLTCD